VGDLTAVVSLALELEQLKTAPRLNEMINPLTWSTRRTIRQQTDFRIENDRVTIADGQVFARNPRNFLRIFEVAEDTGSYLHPDALRGIRRTLHLLDDDLRSDPQAAGIFFNLLTKSKQPEAILRQLHGAGVLGRYIPEFARVTAMMQFNMYHHYTVDEHTIQTISHLAQIEREELVEELPVASKILSEGLNRKVLYTALLLHDIGKGRPEDHSVLGAQIARRVCPRLGLNAEECETVEWLVRYHLLMSDMAQKRDIADPRTVRDFAKAVKTVKRMDLLLILTVCDIRGVGPGTWNNWKAALLRALYRQTRRALEGGMEALNRDQRGTDAKRSLREALKEKGWPSKDIRTETARHNPTYWQGLHLTAHLTFAELLRNIDDTEVSINATADTDRDATRICFAMADHPGLFSRITGALALAGANVVDARSYTSSDGYVTAIFWCQDSTGQAYETSKLKRLTQVIDKTLKGGLIAREALAPKDKLKKREKAFDVPTTITFDNEGSEIFTIIEVDTRDRPGLLHDLTRTMAASNINIEAATIATYGEQVVDSFYVKDLFGLKLYSEAKQKTLEARLREAIITGSERADHA
ncbi:MAG: [protein-PII] uridylyltransferase, partial [Pseudomonadota bacterium]